MNIHEPSGSWIILVFGRSWTNLTVHEFLICCSGIFMNSSWTHLVNDHDSLVHELSEFMNVHEQLMFMNKVRVHEQNKFMNSWTFMKVSFVVQEYSWTVHEHVDERSWTFIVFVHEHSWIVHECSWTVHDHLNWGAIRVSVSSRVQYTALRVIGGTVYCTTCASVIKSRVYCTTCGSVIREYSILPYVWQCHHRYNILHYVCQCHQRVESIALRVSVSSGSRVYFTTCVSIIRE